LIKNSQPFGKKIQKTAGGDFFLTHTVHYSNTVRISKLRRFLTAWWYTQDRQYMLSVYVRPSIRLSSSVIVSKRLDVSSKLF